MDGRKPFTIMRKDTEDMRVDFDALEYKVIHEEYLPYPIRGRLKELPDPFGIKSRYDMTQSLLAARKNEEAVVSWLANRVLLLSRANAKWIYNLFLFEQTGTDEQRVRIAMTCRAVSVLDPYWLKFDDDKDLSWSSVDVRRNPLNEIVAQVALHGKSLTLAGSPVTPELTTNDAHAKAWRRHPDGTLWLYKLGANGNTESRIEVMCSNLLDKMNVEHVHYEAGQDEEKYVCMCPCMTTEEKLFDHNNAFDIDFMRDMDAPYQFGGMTIREAAAKAMQKVDFHFTAPVTRADFITDRQYASFKKRAEYPGL